MHSGLFAPNRFNTDLHDTWYGSFGMFLLRPLAEA